MREREAERAEQAFEDFYRSSYSSLVRDVLFVGGLFHEADEAVAAAMLEVFWRWDSIEKPRAYARKAAISNLIKIKNKQQRLTRIQEQLVQDGNLQLEDHMDPGLTAWEQKDWVTSLLKRLPPAQRAVVACVVDSFTREEIAQLLGKNEPAVRQNLHAGRKRLKSYLTETGSTTHREGDR